MSKLGHHFRGVGGSYCSTEINCLKILSRLHEQQVQMV